MKSMKGKIAVVTGASRGAGRGIALVLGEACATVYVTGRSVRDSSSRPELPGTSIDETAEMVTARGGMGIPVRCDHTNDQEVEDLFARVETVLAVIAPDREPSPEEYEQTESVEYIGRAVVALASDLKIMNKSGQTWTVGDLAREYGFSDIDDRQVPPFHLPDEYLMD
ncbi:MAG: short-chain dehydrogenase [Chloroflexi bacterium HGW-Chloroflexi-3]|nr:MAG: short-chain dehydrogenase [Chloroflexi bacterium HGW-Chloroflexi-3]